MSRKRKLSFCEDAGSYRAVLVPRKVMEKILLEVTYKYEKKKKVVGNIQVAFTKGKLDLTNLMTFYEEVIGSVD